MGIFFDDKKPKITKEEWKIKVRTRLYDQGIEVKEIDFVEGLFYGDMHEEGEKEKGIQIEEIAQRIKWLKENSSLHTLSNSQIEALEKELLKLL